MTAHLGIDFSRNGLLVIAKSALLCLLFLGMYSTVTFTQSTRNAVNRNFGAQNEQNLYGLRDTLITAEPFREFRQDPSRLRQLAEFYNVLNSSEEISFTSAFNQPLPIADFRGGDGYDGWQDMGAPPKGVYRDPISGRDMQDVLSLQLNQRAFEFAGFEVAEGQGFDWDRVDYSASTLPVLLGSGYSSLYTVGDVLAGELYGQQFSFRIIGILEPNSSMFYQGTFGFFVDDRVIVPYPPRLDIADDTLDFTGILGFAMINTNFPASTALSTDDVTGLIAQTSAATGFTSVELKGVPQYLTQLFLVRELLLDNVPLVISLQVALSVACGFIVISASGTANSRRLRFLRVIWFSGGSVRSQRRSMWAMAATKWVLAGTGFAVIVLTLPNREPLILLGFLLTMSVVAIVDVTTSARSLGHRLHSIGSTP